MNANRIYTKRFEDRVEIHEIPEKLFEFADDHRNFSSHMNKSSWMMGGGKMATELDEENGKKIGSHIRMGGNVFGIHLFLDEVVTVYDPPHHKEWETVGNVNLVVIDHYILGFEILPRNDGSTVKVFIYYNLPKSWKTKWLGSLFGEMYAKWCVKQMLYGIKEHFHT